MKKTIFTFILLMLTAVMLFSACSDKGDTNDPFYNPDAGKNQVSYIFEFINIAGESRKVNVASDKGVSLGTVLEERNYIKSENGVVVQVFNQALSVYENDIATPYWQLSVNATETDQSIYELIPESNKVYTLEMKMMMK